MNYPNHSVEFSRAKTCLLIDECDDVSQLKEIAKQYANEFFNQRYTLAELMRINLFSAPLTVTPESL